MEAGEGYMGGGLQQKYSSDSDGSDETDRSENGLEMVDQTKEAILRSGAVQEKDMSSSDGDSSDASDMESEGSEDA